MITEARIAPPNSLLLVMDRDGGEIPESMGGQLVVATPSCIAIGTLPEMDGETVVVLADEKIYVGSGPDLQLVFKGAILTPQKRVDVCNVLLDVVVSLDVPYARSNIEVWTNDLTEPDKICIIVGPSAAV